jgi:hypothetical protein
MREPEWFPWNDEPSDHTGWYDKDQMDAYVNELKADIAALDECIRSIRQEAHDEIETLRAANAKLRDTLASFITWGTDDCPRCETGRMSLFVKKGQVCLSCALESERKESNENNTMSL